MWIHQTGDLYECTKCGAIEHVKSIWRFCPVCGDFGMYYCDPEKNTRCTKTMCFINEGDCDGTIRQEFSKE